MRGCSTEGVLAQQLHQRYLGRPDGHHRPGFPAVYPDQAHTVVACRGEPASIVRSYAWLPLRFGVWLALLLASLAGAATAAAPAPQDIRFPTGTHSVDLRGSVQGDAARSYRLPASAGQTLRVELQASRGAQYFNIVSPGSNEAMFRGDIGGLRAEVLLPADGVYLIQTYLMRSAARPLEPVGPPCRW